MTTQDYHTPAAPEYNEKDQPPPIRRFRPNGRVSKPPQPPPGINLCECPGCRRHIARLEELNRQLAQEIDRRALENARLCRGDRRRAA